MNNVMNLIENMNVAFVRALIFVLCWSVSVSCHQTPTVSTPSYTYIEPSYSDMRLVPQSDTLHFSLGDRTYNSIGSFNYFKHGENEFISFFDRGSKSINIYNFSSQVLVSKIPLKQWTNKGKLDKASVYVKNFDTIYVTTQTKLYVFDSVGTVKNSIDFPTEFDKWGFFSNTAPAVFKGGKLYVGIKPFISEKSVKAQQQWKLFYELDLQKKIKERYYSLSEPYHRNLYGYSFLEYGYCFNEKGNFVVSFAADTNIYETDLSGYHRSYSGRSRFQRGDILPVTIEDLRKADSYQHYCVRDSYGPIFYDPYRRRYLREAKQKMSEAEFLAKTGRKKKSIIIFDESFKIIGETETNGDFSFTSIFFTPDGRIYARVKNNDEHALHIVRLDYEQERENATQLAQHPILGSNK